MRSVRVFSHLIDCRKSNGKNQEWLSHAYVRRVLYKVDTELALLSVQVMKTCLNLPKRDSSSTKEPSDQLSEHHPGLSGRPERRQKDLGWKAELYLKDKMRVKWADSLGSSQEIPYFRRFEKGLHEYEFSEYAF